MMKSTSSIVVAACALLALGTGADAFPKPSFLSKKPKVDTSKAARQTLRQTTCSALCGGVAGCTQAVMSGKDNKECTCQCAELTKTVEMCDAKTGKKKCRDGCHVHVKVKGFINKSLKASSKCQTGRTSLFGSEKCAPCVTSM